LSETDGDSIKAKYPPEWYHYDSASPYVRHLEPEAGWLEVYQLDALTVSTCRTGSPDALIAGIVISGGKATKPIAQVTGCAGGMKQGNAAVGNGTPATGAATAGAHGDEIKGVGLIWRKFNPNKSTQAVLQSVR